MAGSNNENNISEIDIIVGDEAENKAMFENMANESADKSDSGIQTESLLISDSNVCLLYTSRCV